MLQAVLQGKAGRVEVGGESHSWRELFQKREDLLTAVFFGRLRYLSEDGLRQILKILLPGANVAHFGALREIVYWPRLTLKGDDSAVELEPGVVSECQVEPDVILHFADTILLVEVKRPGGEQGVSQWRRQIRALLSDEDYENLTCLQFLALGGIQKTSTVEKARLKSLVADHGKELFIFETRWQPVANAIDALAQDETTDRWIFRDLAEAFPLFGLKRDVGDFSKVSKGAFHGSQWRQLLESFESPLPKQSSSAAPGWFDLIASQKINAALVKKWQ